MCQKAALAPKILLAVDLDDDVVLLEFLRAFLVLVLYEVRRELADAQREAVRRDALLLPIVGRQRLERRDAEQLVAHGPDLDAPREVFLPAPALRQRDRRLRALSVAIDLGLDRAGRFRIL